VNVKKEKLKILHKVSGHAVPGEFLAIMGPTGSGKTTLLNVLAERLTHNVSGKILVNGLPPTKNFKRQCALVQQEDILFPNLTVEQTLNFTASLRLPDEMGPAQKRERVNNIIDMLNLGKAKKTIIGGPYRRGISGGEKKRVNIGNQLLTDPTLIFLDEPTSGLDTSSAINLLQILKGMASFGYCIVASIHQPSSQMFELFDKLLFLVEGRNIYFGKANEAIDYFSRIGLKCERFYNPADFMMGLILKEELSKIKGESLKAKLLLDYKENIYPQKVHKIREEDEHNFNKCKKAQEKKPSNVAEFAVSPLTQYTTLLKRSFFIAKGEYLTIYNFSQIFFVAAIVGILWLVLTGVSWIGSAGFLGWIVHLISAWCAYNYAKEHPIR